MLHHHPPTAHRPAAGARRSGPGWWSRPGRGARRRQCPATVDVRSTLKVRSAPSLAAKVVGSVRDSQKVTVSCVMTGQNVRGSVRTTNLWDKLGTGRYIPHAYVRAARTDPALRRPAAPSQAVPVKAKTASRHGHLQGRHGQQRRRQGQPARRRRPPPRRSSGRCQRRQGADLVCGVVGTLVNGTVRSTTQWNRLSDRHLHLARVRRHADPAPVPGRRDHRRSPRRR